MRGLIFALALVPWIANAKDYVLNFEQSCFAYYGEQEREEIIQDAMDNWNNIPGTPKTFVRGEDLEFEIDEKNFRNYLWDPSQYAPGQFILLPSHISRHRFHNPIICDESGEILEGFNNLGRSGVINGFAATPKPPAYDFFAIYINESHGIKDVPINDWAKFYGNEITIPGGRLSKQQMTSLLTHELGHIIGLGHVGSEWKQVASDAFMIKYVEPIGDFPIMWLNVYNHSAVLEHEDLEEYRRVIKTSGLGKDDGFSFEVAIKRIRRAFKDDSYLYSSDGSYFIEDGSWLNIRVITNNPIEHRQKKAEILVVAKSHDLWFYYKDNEWHPIEENFSGDEITLGISNEKQVFGGSWKKDYGEIEIYFGISLEGKIYFNNSKPIKIK